MWNLIYALTIHDSVSYGSPRAQTSRWGLAGFFQGSGPKRKMLFKAQTDMKIF